MNVTALLSVKCSADSNGKCCRKEKWYLSINQKGGKEEKKSIILYRNINYSRKAESCFGRADPKEDLRMETDYLGGTMV